MSVNLNAALSSFIAASPRIIHHSKTLHWKKTTKKNSSTDLSRDQNTICVWTQHSNSCSSSAGRLVYGPTNTWMGHKCFYLFIYFYFALRHRPLSLPQSPPHQCCAGWLWVKNRLQRFSDHQYTEPRTVSFGHVRFENRWADDSAHALFSEQWLPTMTDTARLLDNWFCAEWGRNVSLFNNK